MADTSVLMTISHLVEAVDGSCLCNYSLEKGFFSVAIDSRNVKEGSLFVPLMGEKQDGHNFILEALELGASIIFVDEQHAGGSTNLFASLAKKYKACIIQVKNTLYALQDAARCYVKQFPSLIKIGITGSSGKTTTKEIVASILSQKYSVIYNEGNLNSETGLPLSVFNIREEHEVGVFELGMSRTKELYEISRVLSPNYAVITNIGTAHIGILGSRDRIAEEKKSIFITFNEFSSGFVYENDDYASFLMSNTIGTIKTFGENTTQGFVDYIDKGLDGSLIHYYDESINFPLPGKHNVLNALAGISIAQELHCSVHDIRQGLEDVKPLFGRAEVIKKDVTILLDCYNANLESMLTAIEYINSLDWKKDKILILGSMLELGEFSYQAHSKVCACAAKSGAKYIFLFGKEIIESSKDINWDSNSLFCFEDSIEALYFELKTKINKGDLLLIKGSRGMALERLIPFLDKKVEE